MQILVLSATLMECHSCFDWLDEHPGLPVKRLVGGLGQLATAVALQKQVFLNRPDCIVQAGIAGAADKNDRGAVFAIDREVMADLGADEPPGFRSLFEMRLTGWDDFPFAAGLLPNPWQKLVQLTGLPVRTGLTVNHISTDKNLIQSRKQNFPSFVESMEGAALHYVALTENIPFVQIRAVSNEAGDRDKSRWQIKESVTALNIALQSLIQKLLNSDETDFRL